MGVAAASWEDIQHNKINKVSKQTLRHFFKVVFAACSGADQELTAVRYRIR
jgi:hypothetical protein